jgi:hypothetical protein
MYYKGDRYKLTIVFGIYFKKFLHYKQTESANRTLETIILNGLRSNWVIKWKTLVPDFQWMLSFESMKIGFNNVSSVIYDLYCSFFMSLFHTVHLHKRTTSAMQYELVSSTIKWVLIQVHVARK